MRAIGKGSLASILAMGLHVTRVIMIIVIVGLAIALAVLPLASGVEAYLSTLDNGSSVGDLSVSRSQYFDIAYSFVAAVVMLFVVNRLLEILKTLRFGSPFVRENADHFRAVGYALLVGEGAKFVFGAFTLIFDANVEINTELNAWLAIIAVFVLSEVFREGARMKEEQDLTV